MRHIARIALAASLLAFGGAARANDSMAQLGAGGLQFVTSDSIQMLSEDLTISPQQVKVVYTFKNDAPTDQHALIAFPLPDITGSPESPIAIPSADSTNIFGFKTTFDGKPVDATLYQYAFAAGVDRSDYLRSIGSPLTPFGDAARAAINALSDADHQRMAQLGLAQPLTYEDGGAQKTDWSPVWTLKSTYAWEADFPASQTVTVVHTYTPSVGGTVATTFLASPTPEQDRAAEYRKKYCTDNALLATLKKSLKDPKDPYSAPYTESWLSYVWSTGANWNGPIKDFHLTIDKGDPKALVSFCWDGKVTKTGPTTFSMSATDFYPPQDHELDILLLNPMHNN